MRRLNLHLPRTVYLLGAISFMNDAASDAVYPLLPLFIASVLMAGPQALGIVEGAANAVAALMKLISGALYDRYQKAKPWMLLGYALPAIGRPLIALATSVPMLMALRLADRVGKGLRTSPRDALLAASVAPEKRGLAFGFHRSMDHAGAVAGPLIAAALLTAGWSLQSIFIATLLPGVLCVVLTLWVKEEGGVLPQSGAIAWQWRTLPAPLKRYLLALAVFTLGLASNMFLLLQAKQAGLTDAQIPLLWAALSGAAMLLSTPLSAWSDRVDRRRLIGWAWAAYGLLFAGFGFAPATAPWTLAFFALYAVFLAATEGAEKALVAQLVPREQLGTAFGWFHLISGVMLLPASALFGWLWERAGARAAFATAAALAIAAAVLMLRAPAAQPADF
ncbi:MAG: MFS transporter [Burkholderiaceae bacterium]